MTKHIVIGVPADIWPEMKAEYERLSGKCRIVIARYRGRPIVETVIHKGCRDHNFQRGTPGWGNRGSDQSFILPISQSKHGQHQ